MNDFAQREPAKQLSRFVLRHEGNRYTFSCYAVLDGVPINPRLPESFGDTANEARPARHMALWCVPFIETQECFADAIPDERRSWLKAWPSGTRYDVRCLDGGAWDRPTCWGQFATMDQAIACAKRGPSWNIAGGIAA